MDMSLFIVSAPKVSGLYSGLRPILHPSFVENLLSSFCINLRTQVKIKPP